MIPRAVATGYAYAFGVELPQRGRGLRITVGQELRAAGGLVRLSDRRGGQAKRVQRAQKAAIGLV